MPVNALLSQEEFAALGDRTFTPAEIYRQGEDGRYILDGVEVEGVGVGRESHYRQQLAQVRGDLSRANKRAEIVDRIRGATEYDGDDRDLLAHIEDRIRSRPDGGKDADVEARIAQARQEEASRWKAKVEEVQGKLTTLEGTVEAGHKAKLLREALAAHPGANEALLTPILDAKTVMVGEGDARILVEVGPNGEPLPGTDPLAGPYNSAGQVLKALSKREQYADAFKSTAKGGDGATPTPASPGGAPTINPFAKKTENVDAAIKLFESDRAKAKSLYEAAKTAGELGPDMAFFEGEF